jgi:CheY-like chemotaxis protein
VLLEHRPAVALLDLDMPGRAGLELVRAIRGSADLRSTYVIVLTAAPRSEGVAISLSAGADRHLLKPYPADALRDAIAQGLALRAPPREASRESLDW